MIPVIRSPARPIAIALSAITLCAGAELAAAQRSDTIVKLAGAPRYRGVARLVPELTIGVVEGPEEYTFGSPSEVLMQRDGSFVVLDWAGGSGPANNAIVRRYGGDGKYIRTIGGQGSGPGEYVRPTGLAELPDGRLLLGDSRNNRINVYSAAGESVASWNARGYMAMIRGGEWLSTDPRGRAYLRFLDPSLRGTPSDISIVRYNTDGTVADTLAPPKMPDTNVPRLTARGSSGGSYSTFVAYWPRSYWALSHLGYFITGVSNRYAIDIRKDGQVLSIRRNVPAIPVSAAERTERRNYARDWLQFYGTFNGSIPETPRTKPFFKSITSFTDGRIWVLLSTPSERFEPPPHLIEGKALPVVRWREPVLFDVFEADGAYVGQVAVPHGVSLEGARGDVAWGTTRGELDVPLIVRYRIAWTRP